MTTTAEGIAEAGPDRPQQRRKGGRPRLWRNAAWLSSALLTSLACITLLAALDRFFGFGIFPPPLQAQLRAAAQAVAPAREDMEPARYAEAHGKGVMVTVPVQERYDRERAIRLALELDSEREKLEELIVRVVVQGESGVTGDAFRRERARIAELAGGAESKVREFLAVGPSRARVILYALGWPWLRYELDRLSVSDLRAALSERPGPLQGIEGETFSAMVARVQRAPSWLVARMQLEEQHRLTESQLEALRAHVCRKYLKKAFVSWLAKRRAKKALARYATLTPAQVRTVLAMAGALELTGNGTQAFPALVSLLDEWPLLALPLLHKCVEANEIERQAHLAATGLFRSRSARARGELVALGPFGADALAAAAGRYPAEVRDAARGVLEVIKARWPQEGSALEVLGSDPERWRRWYEHAREVL